jgi:hypothetical protein
MSFTEQFKTIRLATTSESRESHVGCSHARVSGALRFSRPWPMLPERPCLALAGASQDLQTPITAFLCGVTGQALLGTCWHVEQQT